MIIVRNFAQFEKTFVRLKDERDLFGFFLFDSGHSQEVVQKFANEGSDLIDGLAKSARMYFFVPLRNKGGGKFENPSLEVGQMFGIKPNQLPGVVLFTVSTSQMTSTRPSSPGVRLPSEPDVFMSQGVYLPLKTELFQGDALEAERVFRDLFSLIQECREESGDSDELLEKLRDRVSALDRTQKVRPILMSLAGSVTTVIAASGPLLVEFLRQLLTAYGVGGLLVTK